MPRTLIVAAASALLLAAAVTELSSRLFPGNYFALLLLSFIALSINGLFNVRQAALQQPATAPAPRPERSSNRKGSERNSTEQKRSGQSRRSSGERGQGESNRGRAREPRKEGQNNRPQQDERKASKGQSAAAPPSGPREEGTVKWFDRSKGFGFVIRSDGEEIFVHQRSIRSNGDRGRPNLSDGAAVSFVVTESPRGRQAEDVTLASD